MAKAKEAKPVEVVEEAVEEVVEDTFDVDAYLNELVPFYAFRDNDKYKYDLIVGVNGKIFRIKRGEQVMIPRYVYKVIERGMQQDAHTADLISNQANAYAAEARSWNV